MKSTDLWRVADAFEIFRPQRLLFTKLDETGSFGPIWSEAARSGVPGAGASVLKLRVGEAFQELADVGLRVLGRAGLAIDDVDGLRSARILEEYLRGFGLTIGGGTSQIQRNIIAERVLGLPADIRVDKDVPFNQIPTSPRG